MLVVVLLLLLLPACYAKLASPKVNSLLLLPGRRGSSLDCTPRLTFWETVVRVWQCLEHHLGQTTTPQMHVYDVVRHSQSLFLHHHNRLEPHPHRIHESRSSYFPLGRAGCILSRSRHRSKPATN